MKKTLYTLAAVAALSLAAGCGKGGESHDHGEHATEESHENHDHESEDHDHETEIAEHGKSEHHHGDDEIELHAHQARELGVETTKIVPVEFVSAVNVGGEVLMSPQSQGTVAARTSGIVTLSPLASEGSTVSKGSVVATVSASGMAGGDVNKANRIAMQAAKAELDRLKPLYEDGLVTAREYQDAVTAYEMAANSSTGASSSVQATSPIAGVITSVAVQNGSYVDAGSPIATVSSLGRLTVKAEVPARYASLAQKMQKANIECPDGTVLPAVRTSVATGSGEMKGYFPMFFTVENNASVVPGAYVQVSLLGDEGQEAVTVPRKAVVEKLSRKFVYVKTGDDCYERRPVTLGESDGLSYMVMSGLQPGEEVVTEGVTFVRLAESSGAIPEGHSHHH